MWSCLEGDEGYKGRKFKDGGNGLFPGNIQIGCTVAVACTVPGGLDVKACARKPLLQGFSG